MTIKPGNFVEVKRFELTGIISREVWKGAIVTAVRDGSIVVKYKNGVIEAVLNGEGRWR